MIRTVPPSPLLDSILTGPDWTGALCAQTDPDIFFPPDKDGKGTQYVEARKVCARCPLQQVCLDYALANDERFGLWGGKSPHERERLQHTVTTAVGPSAHRARTEAAPGGAGNTDREPDPRPEPEQEGADCAA